MEMELTKEEHQALEKIQSDKLKGIYLYLIYFSQGLKGIDAKQTDKKTKGSLVVSVEATRCSGLHI